MALDVQCITLTPPTQPRLQIPNFGIMEKAWGALGRIPSSDELLCQFLDILNVALAPIKNYMEMIQVIGQIFDCITALPDVITSMDVAGLYDCLDNLAKLIGVLLSQFPPISLVVMTMDLSKIFMDLIDEVISFFQEIDTLIDSYINILARARALGDTELVRIVGCANSNLNIRLGPVIDTLMFVKPLIDFPISVFLKLLPGGGAVAKLGGFQDTLNGADSFMDAFKTAATGGTTPPSYSGGPGGRTDQDPDVPLPPIGDLLYAMNEIRNVYVELYNFIGPYVGRNDKQYARSLPTFQHL